MQDKLIIRGARENNLKNVSLEIPRGTLTVITGLSGSGKSSLAFNTIYAEGQRRYVESLSAYARQFLGLMHKPDVDSIEGLSPAISIEQKTTSKNPRSTVGTVTEIYDYLRLLYARVGIPHCPKCGKKIASQTSESILQTILAQVAGKKLAILSPVVRGKKGTYEKMFDDLKKKGFSRVRVNGDIIELEGYKPALDKQKKHNIEIIVDRIMVKGEERSRIFDAIKMALRESEDGALLAQFEGKELLFSQKNACPDCGISLGDLQPRMFSFNSPFGACTQCHGLGIIMEFDPELVIPDRKKSILEGAIAPWNTMMIGGYYTQQLKFVGKKYGFDLTTPIEKMSKKQLDAILRGVDEKMAMTFESRSSESYWKGESKFEGVIPNLERLYKQTESEWRKEEIAKFMRERPCEACGGQRLKPESLAVKIEGKSITGSTRLSIDSAYGFFTSLKLSKTEEQIAKQILKEIKSRLEFLLNVGLGYLTLDRISGTLSGGEAQRIRLATQIGSNLTGVLYVLDEPSIGLHQRDNRKLINTLKDLRDLGNTLIVVEHDEETMRNSDFMIDMGPGAGIHGGQIVAIGEPQDIINSKSSITGAYLRGEKKIATPEKRRKANGNLIVRGAKENNLKNIDVRLPLGVMCCITGVSGSGKSTLVNEILYKALMQKLYNSREAAGAHKGIDGLEQIDKVICIDQSPIGRTPRSNPATYIGAFTPIRDLFAQVPESRAKGFDAGQFSFNVQKGRCQKCEGDGVLKIEMHFLPDVYVPCEECEGKRYDNETLSIKFKGKNVSDVLNMSVEEALPFFENIPSIQNKLSTINDVGLGYIKLGQAATTLSGGEAQRVKLAAELSKRGTGKTFYILDEPTTGLHFADVSRLLDVLQRLVEKGNTVLVIEHNLDVIKTADYIVDLGPEGGDDGGEIVAEGTPEEIARNKKSYTGEYLKKVL
jgi:excinuclease ABC subunit A